MKTQTTPFAALRLPALFAVLIGALPAPAGAQTVPPSRPNDEQAIVLSPFTVTSTKDNGYLAADSLAGTRLRTPLRDVAASISVVTKDFLEDTGAKNLYDLLPYTAGTEVTGIEGNYGGFTADAGGSNNYTLRRQINPANRVRGLAAADLTRNFFGSGIPFDSYNAEAVTINRGSNAILFGLGSPAGIIDTTTLQPHFINGGKVEMRVDSNGSDRESLDLERQLVPNKLSFRVAALNDKGRFEQEPSYRNQERLYGALAFRPFRYTTIRANAEVGRIDQSLPRIDPPADYLTPWFQFGKLAKETPIYTGPNFAAGNYPGDPTANPTINYERFHNIDGPAGSWFYNPGVLYGSNSSGSPTDAFVAFADAAAVNGNPALQYRFLAPRGIQDMRLNTLHDPIAPFLATPQITDRSVFDYRKYRLDGPNSGTNDNFHTYSVSLEQLLLNGHAGVELVYNKEHSQTDVWEAMDTNRANYILVDENRYTPDGRLNPNFGRPYESSRGMSSRAYDDTENSRATGFFRHNFAEHSDGWLARLLGEHTVTGFAQQTVTDDFSLNANYAVTDPSFIPGDSSTGIGNRVISSVVYLGPSLINATGPAGAHIPAVTSQLTLPDSIGIYTLNKQNGYTWTKTISAIHTYPDFDYTAKSVSAVRNKTESYGGVWQANLMQNLLVATLGERHDEVTNSTNGPVATNPATGAPFTGRPDVIERLKVGNSLFSQGYALHVPDRWTKALPGRLGLSLYFNRSENFQVTGFRQDGLGNPISPQSGTTKEYGVGVSAFDNKLNFRLTRYETAQQNQSDGGTSNPIAQIAEIEKRIQSTNSPATLAAAGYVGFGIGTPSALYNQFLKTFNMHVDSVSASTGATNLVYTTPTGFASPTDTVSKGYEFEMVYNPTSNWRIMVNATREEATRGAPAGLLAALLADREPYWNKSGVKDLIASAAWTTSTYAQQNIINPYNLRVFQTGTPAAELRKWHANVITNYDFGNKGWLKGWGFGGACRWMDKIVIGYPVIRDPALGLISDVKHPFMGGDYMTFDGWLSYSRTFPNHKFGWKIQLNVRNLLDNNLLVPVQANPVTIGDLTTRQIVAYRIGQARTFEVTSTFSF
ncbi:MAG TPA: TonB-dependent receptor plug domain-containing protein [Opitutaceae bacterium]|nr:TonB-dependent receptor plug domain-containing protein [Opitutaceae bacterium]